MKHDMRWITVIMALALAVMAQGLFAQGMEKSRDTDTAERIAYIQNGFNVGQTRAQVWWYGWMGVYGASAAASYTIGLTSHNDVTRITQVVSAVESTIGLAGLLVSPFTPAYAPSRLRRMPDARPEDRATKLGAAERYLKESAEGEALGRSWIMHSLNFLVNAGGAMVIWKVYGDRIDRNGGDPEKEAIFNFVTSFIVGEIQILTQPMKARRDWNAYEKKYRGASSGNCGHHAVCFVAPSPGGIVFGAAVPF